MHCGIDGRVKRKGSMMVGNNTGRERRKACYTTHRADSIPTRPPVMLLILLLVLCVSVVGVIDS